ncbi:MAG: DMT family transporter [Alphaproteobacteria bacterium]
MTAVQSTPAGWQRGIACSLAMSVCFATIDATAKLLAQDTPVIQVVWGRYVFHFLFLAAFVFGATGLRRLTQTRRLGLQLTRSVLLVGSTASFWLALVYLPLAQAITIGFASPLILTALSVPLLGERVGRYRWTAVVVGLVGVAIVVRPGLGSMHWAVALPLLTAVLYALYQIATRVLSHTDDAMATLFYTGLGGLIVSSIAVPFFWQPPGMMQWLGFVWLGLLGAAGHTLLIKAFSLAPASLLAPFGYTSLIWATILGYLLFAEVPDLWTLVGAAVIIGSGIFIVLREHRLRVVAGRAEARDGRAAEQNAARTG